MQERRKSRSVPCGQNISLKHLTDERLPSILRLWKQCYQIKTILPRIDRRRLITTNSCGAMSSKQRVVYWRKEDPTHSPFGVWLRCWTAQLRSSMPCFIVGMG